MVMMVSGQWDRSGLGSRAGNRSRVATMVVMMVMTVMVVVIRGAAAARITAAVRVQVDHARTASLLNLGLIMSINILQIESWSLFALFLGSVILAKLFFFAGRRLLVKTALVKNRATTTVDGGAVADLIEGG